MSNTNQRLIRVGVFYDGNFFLHVSNYYHYVHSRQARISISGLHDFIRRRIADEEDEDMRYCHIIDAHYFRGRLRAQDAKQRDTLLKERIFDDVLMRQGVTTHYLPLGPDGEKGIDVWLALEAYELAIYKRFDVCVIVACDGDFVPLVRKLNTLGTRVMLLAWDFKYTDQNGNERETRTAQTLLEEATYPVMMHKLIDDRSIRSDQYINGLFVPKSDLLVKEIISDTEPSFYQDNEIHYGTIQNLKEGFGFIAPESGGQNLFFFHASIVNADFNELQIGDQVEYEIGSNDKGPCATNIKVIE